MQILILLIVFFCLYIGYFRNLAVYVYWLISLAVFLVVECLSFAAAAWVKAQANVPLCGTIKLIFNLEH